MELSTCSTDAPLTSSKAATPRSPLLTRIMWLPAIAVLASMWIFADRISAPWRLLLASVVLYAAFKFTAAMKQRTLWSSISPEAWLWYCTIWPGMDLTPFATTEPSCEIAWLRRGVGGMALGAAVLAGAVVLDTGDALGGWLTVGGLLLLVHFGWADVLSYFMRQRGFPVRRLFRPPEKATSLNDFWTRRWNRAFVEMDQILFMPALRRSTGGLAPVLMLAGSGVIHELALSYPAGAGWGLPMLYFVAHGGAMQIERTRWFKTKSSIFTTWWTRLWVLAPVSLVFHRPFRDALPLQLLLTLKGLT